jgi:hypothetical protein
MRSMHQNTRRSIYRPTIRCCRKLTYKQKIDDNWKDLEEDLFEESIDCSSLAECTQYFSSFLLDVKVEGEGMNMFEGSSRQRLIRVLL